MNKIDKNKKKIIAIISGIILIAIIVFLLWFFNRKFDITFDLNNGTKEEVIKVKYKKAINEKDLALTHDGKTYTQDDTARGKSSGFTVNANQNVSWNIEAAVKPSYRYEYKDYKNKTTTSVTGGYIIDSIVESTGAISKIRTDVKVTATTKAEQKISLIIKQYIA